MSNIISLLSYAAKEKRLSMSNQGTDRFLELLIRAAAEMNMTDSQKDLISFLEECREENEVSPGSAYFDIKEMPWNENTLREDTRFMLGVIAKAREAVIRQQPGYEANAEIVVPWLDQFAEMITEHEVLQKVWQLDDHAMEWNTAVMPLPAEDYLETFFDFYEIRDRDLSPVPCGGSLHDSMVMLCGEGRGEPVAEKAESLFGRPGRIMVFEDPGPLTRQLEMSEGGVGPFYFIFDLMFCEYEGFTLCFITGSND